MFPRHRLYLRAALIWILTSTGAASAAESEPEFPEKLRVQYHIGVDMRDGVELATDVYLPGDDGPYPTLLVRDMYTNGTAAGRQRYARWATANGYAFVFQSVRGRADSDGHWYPYFQEINDGGDTIQWIAAGNSNFIFHA